MGQGRIAPRVHAGSVHDHRGTPRHLSRPSTGLAEHWTTLDDVSQGQRVDLFYRESENPVDGPVMMHLHGFGLSGRYLLPTAVELSDDFHTYVPDLPGFGRSGNASAPLDVSDLAHAAADFLTDRGVDSATLVGNSMGCAVICEFAHQYPERIDRAVLIAPAGGPYNQPLNRAIRQLARTGTREPRGLLPVALPDYLRFGVPSTLRLFDALTRFPTLDRLLDLSVPTLVVFGTRDPLMPSEARIRELAAQHDHDSALLVMIDGAAHAINFSHPRELAHAVRLFMADRPVVGDGEPGSAGHRSTYEIHRGDRLPPTR